MWRPSPWSGAPRSSSAAGPKSATVLKSCSLRPKCFTTRDALTPASAAMPRIVTSAYGRWVNARRAASRIASRPVAAGPGAAVSVAGAAAPGGTAAVARVVMRLPGSASSAYGRCSGVSLRPYP